MHSVWVLEIGNIELKTKAPLLPLRAKPIFLLLVSLWKRFTLKKRRRRKVLIILRILQKCCVLNSIDEKKKEKKEIDQNVSLPLSDVLATRNLITIWCLNPLKERSYIVKVAYVSCDVSTYFYWIGKYIIAKSPINQLNVLSIYREYLIWEHYCLVNDSEEKETQNAIEMDMVGNSFGFRVSDFNSHRDNLHCICTVHRMPRQF